MAEKDRQCQIYWISLLTIFLWLLMVPDNISAEEAVAIAQPEKISVFVDRTILQKNEFLKLIVQCNFPHVVLPELEILRSNSFSLLTSTVSSSIRKEYVFKASEAGKYNIQVRGKYRTGASEDALSSTIIREIEDINVQKDSNMDMKTLVGPISAVFGTLLGFAASMGMSLFNEWRAGRKKEKWIFDSLLPQLRLAQSDIAKGEPVRYEIWMSEFYAGGYYSVLQKLSEEIEGNPDLCGDMAAIHSLLKLYERELGNVTIPEDLSDELKKNLSRVITELSKVSST